MRIVRLQIVFSCADKVIIFKKVRKGRNFWEVMNLKCDFC